MIQCPRCGSTFTNCENDSRGDLTFDCLDCYHMWWRRPKPCAGYTEPHCNPRYPFREGARGAVCMWGHWPDLPTLTDVCSVTLLRNTVTVTPGVTCSG